MDGVAVDAPAQHGVAQDAAEHHQDPVSHGAADAVGAQLALQLDHASGVDVADRYAAEAWQQVAVEDLGVAGDRGSGEIRFDMVGPPGLDGVAQRLGAGVGQFDVAAGLEVADLAVAAFGVAAGGVGLGALAPVGVAPGDLPDLAAVGALAAMNAHGWVPPVVRVVRDWSVM